MEKASIISHLKMYQFLITQGSVESETDDHRIIIQQPSGFQHQSRKNDSLVKMLTPRYVSIFHRSTFILIPSVELRQRRRRHNNHSTYFSEVNAKKYSQNILIIFYDTRFRSSCLVCYCTIVEM